MAMERLRTKWLSVVLDGVSHPSSTSALNAMKDQQAAASAARPVTERELTAQEWFERGLFASDPNEKVSLYSHAIQINPNFVDSFINRGVAFRDKRDVSREIEDYDAAIRLRPDYALAPYYNRGIALGDKGDLEGAIRDYVEAIRLRPDYPDAFINLGNAQRAKGDLEGALQNLTEAIRLRSDYTAAFHKPGVAAAVRF